MGILSKLRLSRQCHTFTFYSKIKFIEMAEKTTETPPIIEDKSPTKIQTHQEEHKEESEWHQKGGNESSSWHRVMKMKVTKKTERTSKTEKCTKTYKVSDSNGDGGDGNQQFITVDKTITLPPSNADKVEVKSDSTADASNVGNSNPFESNEQPLLEAKEVQGDIIDVNDETSNNEETKKKKKRCSKCCCCIN